MIGGVLTWGIYSTLLKKKKFTLPLLTLVHIICTFGLVSVFPQFLYELSSGQAINFDINLVYTLIFLALFPSIGSYYCWAGAVSIIGANRAGISLSLIPLFSSIMAITIYDEMFMFFNELTKPGHHQARTFFISVLVIVISVKIINIEIEPINKYTKDNPLENGFPSMFIKLTIIPIILNTIKI